MFKKHACMQVGPGVKADVSVLHPTTEAHLCQLAALENFADHGIFVKFGAEEAVQLEARALDLAVQQSAQDAELTKCVDLPVAQLPQCISHAVWCSCLRTQEFLESLYLRRRSQPPAWISVSVFQLTVWESQAWLVNMPGRMQGLVIMAPGQGIQLVQA